MLKNGNSGNRYGKENQKTEVFFSSKNEKPTYKMAKTVKPKIPTPPSLILVLVMDLNFLI